MSLHLIYLLLLLGSAAVVGRTVPDFSELDEDEQHLFRAAYDAPAYNQVEYEEEDLPLGKLDLVKDGLWAIKAKIKELKAFNKALAANLLSTNLKVKELLKNHLAPIKMHHHEKPNYAPSYQAPAAYPQYEGQYAAPAPQYAAPAPQYAAPAPQYAAPAQYAQDAYAAPQYGAAPLNYRHDPYYGH